MDLSRREMMAALGASATAGPNFDAVDLAACSLSNEATDVSASVPPPLSDDCNAIDALLHFCPECRTVLFDAQPHQSFNAWLEKKYGAAHAQAINYGRSGCGVLIVGLSDEPEEARRRYPELFGQAAASFLGFYDDAIARFDAWRKKNPKVVEEMKGAEAAWHGLSRGAFQGCLAATGREVRTFEQYQRAFFDFGEPLDGSSSPLKGLPSPAELLAQFDTIVRARYPGLGLSGMELYLLTSRFEHNQKSGPYRSLEDFISRPIGRFREQAVEQLAFLIRENLHFSLHIGSCRSMVGELLDKVMSALRPMLQGFKRAEFAFDWKTAAERPAPCHSGEASYSFDVGQMLHDLHPLGPLTWPEYMQLEVVDLAELAND